MTDTAECNLDQKCLMSVSYDGASAQRSGIKGLNADYGQTWQSQSELLNESNHRKRNQCND
jgi:hypothetical protein